MLPSVRTFDCPKISDPKYLALKQKNEFSLLCYLLSGRGWPNFFAFSAQHLDLVRTHILHLTVCFIQKQTRPARLAPRPRVFGTK